MRLLRWLVQLAWCWPLAALAQGLPLEDVAMLVDPGGVETIASVTVPSAAGRFRPVNGALEAGYTRAVHWLRFTVRPPAAGEWWLEIQPPFLDDLRLFEPQPAGASAFRERRGGDRLVFAARPVAYRAFIFPLVFPDAQPRTFYLRLETSSASLLFPRLWQPREFMKAVTLEYALLGGFFGLMATVVLINLVYWSWLRDALHGYFSLHVLMMALAYLGSEGFVGQFLLPEEPAVADYWVAFFFMAAIATSAQFYRRILGIERDRPRLFLLYRTMTVVPLAAIAALFAGYYTEVAPVVVTFNLFLFVAGFGLAYGIWRRGGRDGMLLMVGIAFAILGVAPLILSLLGSVSADMWMLHIRQITLLGSILIMHVAVAARMRETEIRRGEAVIRAEQAEIRAEQEIRAQGENRQFIAMLTHELRTPLSVIDGAVQSLEYLHQPQDEETRLRYRRIRRSVGRINGLVKQFLAKDKVDDARLALCPVSLDGVDLAQAAIRSCVEGAVERVDMEAPASLPLRGDTALLQVALVNLFDNALKYSPPDSQIECRVEALARDGKPGVAWTVADRGAGIDPASWEEVFGKYVRGEGHGHVAGAGLGLYLVRRIAELHGGGIDILERDGWGAVLRLWLPQGDAA